MNIQNDSVLSCDGEVRFWVGTPRQGALSAIEWESLSFVEQSVKLNQEDTKIIFMMVHCFPEQNMAPLTRAEKTQQWLSDNVPKFISLYLII